MAAHWKSADQVWDEEQGKSFGDSVYAEEIARKAGAAVVADEASAWKHCVLESRFAARGYAQSVVNTSHLEDQVGLM